MKPNDFYNLTFKEVPRAVIGVRDNLTDFDPELLIIGQSISDWPSDATLIVEGYELTDYLFYPLSSWITVSEKVQLALRRSNLQGVQFLPLRVEHVSGAILPGYSILNVLDVCSALDVDHTEWMTPEREKSLYPELNIWKIALDSQKLRGKHIFRLAEVRSEVFVSNVFVNSIKIGNATKGFNFIKARIE
jgi:hypothetical protein